MIPAHMQGAVNEEVNNRQAQALEQLKAKYDAGKGGLDSSVDGPTGAAYKEREAEQRRQAKQQREMEAAEEEVSDMIAPLGDDENDDADYELRLLRQQRLKQIKQAHTEKVENLGKGHGQFREVLQDEFLKEVTSSLRVICHFYHRDFPRCNIMDHHLQKLCARHIETKFIKIDAEKAPFFVEKLKIRTIPSVIIFFDGVAKEKIIGFEGLADLMPEGREDEWSTIALARLLGSKMAIDNEVIVDDEGIEEAKLAKLAEMRRNALTNIYSSDLCDDDELLDLDS